MPTIPSSTVGNFDWDLDIYESIDSSVFKKKKPLESLFDIKSTASLSIIFTTRIYRKGGSFRNLTKLDQFIKGKDIYDLGYALFKAIIGVSYSKRYDENKFIDELSIEIQTKDIRGRLLNMFSPGYCLATLYLYRSGRPILNSVDNSDSNLISVTALMPPVTKGRMGHDAKFNWVSTPWYLTPPIILQSKVMYPDLIPKRKNEVSLSRYIKNLINYYHAKQYSSSPISKLGEIIFEDRNSEIWKKRITRGEADRYRKGVVTDTGEFNSKLGVNSLKLKDIMSGVVAKPTMADYLLQRGQEGNYRKGYESDIGNIWDAFFTDNVILSRNNVVVDPGLPDFTKRGDISYRYNVRLTDDAEIKRVPDSDLEVHKLYYKYDSKTVNRPDIRISNLNWSFPIKDGNLSSAIPPPLIVAETTDKSNKKWVEYIFTSNSKTVVVKVDKRLTTTSNLQLEQIVNGEIHNGISLSGGGMALLYNRAESTARVSNTSIEVELNKMLTQITQVRNIEKGVLVDHRSLIKVNVLESAEDIKEKVEQVKAFSDARANARRSLLASLKVTAQLDAINLDIIKDLIDVSAKKGFFGTSIVISTQSLSFSERSEGVEVDNIPLFITGDVGTPTYDKKKVEANLIRYIVTSYNFKISADRVGMNFTLKPQEDTVKILEPFFNIGKELTTRKSLQEDSQRV